MNLYEIWLLSALGTICCLICSLWKQNNSETPEMPITCCLILFGIIVTTGPVGFAYTIYEVLTGRLEVQGNE